MTDLDPVNSARPVEPAAGDPVAEAPTADSARPADDPEAPSAAEPAEAPEAVSVVEGADPEGTGDSAGAGVSTAVDEAPVDEAPADEAPAAAAAIEPLALEWAAPEPPSRRGRGLRWIGTFIAAFVAASIIASSVGAAAIYGYRSAYDGRIPHGVDVGGVDVSGLDPASAEQRVGAAFASMTTGTIVLDAPSGDATIEFADFGRSVDAAAAADRAMAVAKDGDVFDQTLASARTAIDGVTIAPTVSLDPGLLADAIDRAVRRFERPARDAIVTSTPEGVLTQPSQPGMAVDREAIFGAALEQVGRAGAPASIVIPVSQTTIEPALTDREAEAARQAIERMVKPIAIRHGEESWKIAAAAVRPWISVVPTGDGRVVYDIDREQVQSAVKKLRSKVDRKPTNAAYLTSKSGRVIGVKAGRNGRTIDAPLTSERIARAVISRAYGVPAESATAAIVAVEPKLSTAEAEKTAPLLKLISSHTTWFPYGERNYYGANIWIPGRIINGTVLAPGDTFNFFKVVGFPSASRGFGMGGVIRNGKSEPTGALAGGICSNSTTLYNAAAKAGLKLGARAPHYYYIDRYPLGLDATVLFSSGGGGQNLTFTNDTKYPILIVNRNWRVGSRGYVRYEMWSVPNGRKVRFSKPIVKNIVRAGTDVFYTSALPPGVSRQQESPHDGMDVWVTRTVTDASGKTSKQTVYSHYRKVNGLILRGKAATGDNL